MSSKEAFELARKVAIQESLVINLGKIITGVNVEQDWNTQAILLLEKDKLCKLVVKLNDLLTNEVNDDE